MLNNKQITDLYVNVYKIVFFNTGIKDMKI